MDQELKAPLPCPVCQRPMVEQIHHGVSLEACPEHGLWLEPEQLQRIIHNMLESFELGWAKATREQVEIELANEQISPFDILLDGFDSLIDRFQGRGGKGEG